MLHPFPDALRAYATPCEHLIWGRGGHAQTLLAHMLPSPGAPIEPRTGWTRRTVELEDGEALSVFTRPGTSGVRVHLLHGLSGDVASDYMRRAAFALAARGHEVWAVNHRGCGAGRQLATKPYHSGRVDDLQDVLRASRAQAPELVHVVLGFSLSGNIALLQAGRGLAPLPDAILAVNPPVDLERASIDIHRGFNRVYEARFMLRLGRAVRERNRLRAARGQAASALRRVPFGMSLCEFDDAYTAPEAGFADGRDYYRRASSGPHLARIETPTVILSAADDPFVDPSALRDLPRSAAVHLHLEPTGGHVGYLSRRGLGCTRWLEGALIHYVDELTRRRPG